MTEITGTAFVDDPQEARLWPLGYRSVACLKTGDYLIRMGSYERVESVTEDNGDTLVRTDVASYALDSTETCWSLVKPSENKF
jgi:hypothetical protein